MQTFNNTSAFLGMTGSVVEIYEDGTVSGDMSLFHAFNDVDKPGYALWPIAELGHPNMTAPWVKFVHTYIWLCILLHMFMLA